MENEKWVSLLGVEGMKIIKVSKDIVGTVNG